MLRSSESRSCYGYNKRPWVLTTDSLPMPQVDNSGEKSRAENLWNYRAANKDMIPRGILYGYVTILITNYDHVVALIPIINNHQYRHKQLRQRPNSQPLLLLQHTSHSSAIFERRAPLRSALEDLSNEAWRSLHSSRSSNRLRLRFLTPLWLRVVHLDSYHCSMACKLEALAWLGQPFLGARRIVTSPA